MSLADSSNQMPEIRTSGPMGGEGKRGHGKPD